MCVPFCKGLLRTILAPRAARGSSCPPRPGQARSFAGGSRIGPELYTSRSLGMSSPVTVTPAYPHELASAFDLLFQHLDDKERARRSHAALELVRTGELDPTGVLLARSDSTLRGVQVCQVVPGASALLWPPQIAGES